jgi:hypothetical protein
MRGSGIVLTTTVASRLYWETYTNHEGSSLVMLAAIRKLKYGILMAALAGAMIGASAGPAMAAKMVTSDTVKWKGSFSAATGELRASACALKSDTETTAFPCQLTGAVRPLPIGGPVIEVESTWVSADGIGVFGPLLANRVVSKPPIATYAGTGPCEEQEESDLPGTKGPISYPCEVSVKLTFNTAKSTVTGVYSVKEESTRP